MNRVIMRLFIIDINYSKIIILGAMTWPCYIENSLIMRRVIMRLNCSNVLELKCFLTIFSAG